MVTITINIISTTAIIMGWVDKNKNPTLKWTILLATEAFRIRHKAVQIKHLHLRALGDYTNVSIRPGMRDGEGLVSRQQLELPPDSHHISVHQSRSVLHYFHHKEGGLFAWLDNWWLKVPSHAQHHDGSPWGPCYLSTWAHN